MRVRAHQRVPLNVAGSGKKLRALARAGALSRDRDRHLTDAATGFVTSRGARIAWYEYGPADAEMTVVLIHGFTLAAEAFYPQVEYLRAEWPSVKVLLLDLRGHGASEQVAMAECTVDNAADDVIAVLKDRLSTARFLLLGHSLGGPVALAAVRRMPEGMRQRLAGMAQLSSAAEELTAAGVSQLIGTGAAAHAVTYLAQDRSRTTRLRNLVSGLLAPLLTLGVFIRETDDKIIDFHAALIHETPNDTLFGFFDDLREHQEESAIPLLRGVPGYVLVGEKDAVTPPSQSQRLVQRWPDAKYQVAHAAGHMIPLEAPAFVNAALGRLLGQLGEAESGTSFRR